jgi:hypothetical protein
VKDYVGLTLTKGDTTASEQQRTEGQGLTANTGANTGARHARKLLNYRVNIKSDVVVS